MGGIVAEDYIEKVTPNGVVIRVNSRKNTYMLFRNNEPIKNPRSNTQSIIHELPQIIFLGKEFEIRSSISERIKFFEVIGGQIYIPFWVTGMSDVRHVKLPALVDSDLLPVYVHQFQAFHVGSIPILASGVNYFVVESKIDREMLIRLKMNFPTSRVIIYRGEKDSIYDTFAGEREDASKAKTTRASDLMESEDSNFLTQNPSFAARVFLRRMHLDKIYEIPELYAVKTNDLEMILGYLRVMRKKADEQSDIKQNLEKIDDLIDLFLILAPIFSYDIRDVERIFDAGIPKQHVLVRLKKILKSQSEINKATFDGKKQRFYENAIAMIEPLIIDDNNPA